MILAIYDNARYHTSKTTKNFIVATGITALTLPPYHPEFNPVELVINFIKAKVAGQVR